jgi:hypothetical protein
MAPQTILHKLITMPMLLVVGTMVTDAGKMEAQTVNWVSAGSPAARCCMSMAYDPATHSTLLFSGTGGGPTYYDDTWIWRGGWLQVSPATSPPARDGAGMAFDGAGNMVLFGGYSSTGSFLNDTWTWDGANWAQQFPPVSPSARTTEMAYDPATGTAVLFGGGGGGGALGDTWTWNGPAKTWTQQHPAASPSARSAPMTYDQSAKTILLFGGNGNDAVQFTDTWNWNGTTWIQQFPVSAPSARTAAAMTYDSGLGAAVLFGGFDGVWENSLNDTWPGTARIGRRSIPPPYHLTGTHSAWITIRPTK